MDALLDTKEISAVTTIMDIDPLAAPTVRRNPSIKRLLKFPWGGQHQGQGKHLTIIFVKYAIWIQGLF